MKTRLSLPRPFAGTLALLLCAATGQAQFVENSSDIPNGGPANNSVTENIDFGDVDGDGDWDAVFADGGDNGLDQNRIWINRGPGVNLGKFEDETASRCPAINDQSRDVEFVDFDGDADLDLYISNTSSLIAAGCRWWRNSGGGFYVDETAQRWVGIGQAGSSVGPAYVLSEGSFLDFSGDGDFADIDNDGDMDLFHSSYGGVFSGNVPSRVFLNNGSGFFEEFNPSGFQLTGTSITSGTPGLWCEGVQTTDTLVSDGTQCDIASAALDIDFGDTDGDFDLDLLHGARHEVPRMFENRLEENAGVLGFRDVTGAVFPANYSSGNGHYEQEMGDLDGDGDLDILGINWLSNPIFTDSTLRNLGDGTFANHGTLPNSGSDDNEGDFFDYDNDGDLDIFVANFSGTDRLYRNSNIGGANFDFTHVSFPSSPHATLDSDCCDVDGDGDYDIFSANEFHQPNTYFENISQIADSHAPYLPNVEQASDRQAGSEPTVVRVHVYDNAPYYITWYNTTRLIYTVNGSNQTSASAISSGGQVFRGEIPGNLVGTVQYHFTSEDEYGNQSSSASLSYNSAGPALNTGMAYCFGDGTGSACPCAFGASGQGCQNSTGAGATLTGAGHASFSADSFSLSVSGAPGNKPGLVVRGSNAVALVVGDGILCTSAGINRSQVVVTSPAGTATYTNFNGLPFGSVAFMNAPTNFQFYFRDQAGSCTGLGFNFTNAWTVSYQP